MNEQKEHYVQMHDSYIRHYFDDLSLSYRKKFIYLPMFKDLINSRKQINVMELAASSGENSLEFLKLFPDSNIKGCDISTPATIAYRKNVGRDCFETDLTVHGELSKCVGDEKFDILFVVGGIHHCVANLEAFFENAKSVLKPKGALIMYEPNQDAFYEVLRKWWYLLDNKNFASETEHALSAQELFDQYGKGFFMEKLVYLGGPAYFLILNSLILRIPLGLKKIIFKPLMFLEKHLTPFLAKRSAAVFVSIWRMN